MSPPSSNILNFVLQIAKIEYYTASARILLSESIKTLDGTYKNYNESLVFTFIKNYIIIFKIYDID